jgi:hypothetical protein
MEAVTSQGVQRAEAIEVDHTKAEASIHKDEKHEQGFWIGCPFFALIFASKQNKAKRCFIFACFCKTKIKKFCFISLPFTSNIFPFLLQSFCFKTKTNFFVILLQPFCFKTFFLLFCFDFFSSKHFFTILIGLFCSAI